MSNVGKWASRKCRPVQKFTTIQNACSKFAKIWKDLTMTQNFERSQIISTFWMRTRWSSVKTYPRPPATSSNAGSYLPRRRRRKGGERDSLNVGTADLLNADWSSVVEHNHNPCPYFLKLSQIMENSKIHRNFQTWFWNGRRPNLQKFPLR